jgi:hypothetical protein
MWAGGARSLPGCFQSRSPRIIAAFSRLRLIEIAMSIAVLGNALFHAAAAAGTVSYSPGLVTALLLWIPLGVVRLRRSRGDCFDVLAS